MMDNWQFFLQKEGDYAWLPLETPQVEILEGRYQLIAHTSNAGQSVRVNIRHQYELDNIPQENIQESNRPIEVSGKIEILPLVYLGLGSWSISCSVESDAADTNTSGKTETFDLEIEVLSQDFDLFEDWNFDALESEEKTESLESVLPWLEEAVQEPEEIPAAAPLAPTAIMEAPKWELEDEIEAIESLESVIPAETIVSEETTESLPELIEENSEVTLHLPSFSGELPQVVFRTVSPQELPQRVCDRELTEAEKPKSPQLPTFTHVKSIAFRKQNQRARSLSKMKLIASAVNQKEQPNEIATGSLQQKFHDKLNRIAVTSSQ